MKPSPSLTFVLLFVIVDRVVSNEVAGTEDNSKQDSVQVLLHAVQLVLKQMIIQFVWY